jgi:hypothetical protein
MRERTPEGSSAAAKPARAAAPPSAATPAARVLALQRSHGNRAVTRLLARQPGVRTPKQMFEEDVTARKWDRALSALGTLDKSQIGPALGFLTPDQLRYLDDEATREGMSSSGTVRAGIGKALVGQGVTKEHAKSGRGFGKASAKYGKIMSGKKNATDYSVEISLDFKPDPAAVAADEITWIQTVRTVDTATGALNEPRPEFSSRATPSSWMLDRMEGRTHGWYGFADDASAQNNVRPWRRAAPKTSAWMWDQPAWDVPNMTWEFEAAAVCRTGSADTAMRKGDKPGFVYAVVTWGFDTGAHGEVKTHKIKVWNKPTDEFGEAVGLWNAQARNELATMNAPGQQQLPAVQ